MTLHDNSGKRTTPKTRPDAPTQVFAPRSVLSVSASGGHPRRLHIIEGGGERASPERQGNAHLPARAAACINTPVCLA